MTITTIDKLKCAQRELALRKNFYPKWIKAGKLKPEDAAREIDLMAAIATDYQERAAHET